MPADLLQMEEIQSLNRILITGQRRVYTVEPFQLGHNTNKTEEGAGIAIPLLGFWDSVSGPNTQPEDFLLFYLLMQQQIHIKE